MSGRRVGRDVICDEEEDDDEEEEALMSLIW